jgi:hypothetical protein
VTRRARHQCLAAESPPRSPHKTSSAAQDLTDKTSLTHCTRPHRTRPHRARSHRTRPHCGTRLGPHRQDRRTQDSDLKTVTATVGLTLLPGRLGFGDTELLHRDWHDPPPHFFFAMGIRTGLGTRDPFFIIIIQLVYYMAQSSKPPQGPQGPGLPSPPRLVPPSSRRRPPRVFPSGLGIGGEAAFFFFFQWPWRHLLFFFNGHGGEAAFFSSFKFSVARVGRWLGGIFFFLQWHFFFFSWQLRWGRGGMFFFFLRGVGGEVAFV